MEIYQNIASVSCAVLGPAIESTREIENKRETGVRAWSAPIVCKKKIEFCELVLSFVRCCFDTRILLPSVYRYVMKLMMSKNVGIKQLSQVRKA